MKRSAATLDTVVLVFALAVAAGSEVARASDDRLIFGVNGSTLSGASGGGGAVATWLHGFNAGTFLGVGAEHQDIANSHWTLGIATGAVTLGTGSEPRTSFSAELRKGAGEIAGRGFDYQIVTLDASRTLTQKLSLQLEDRQIDVDTSHGNLPKLGVSYLWTPRFQSSLAYAHSEGGNLGTQITSVRVDYFGARTSFLGGGAYGQGAPAVFDLQTGLRVPGAKLKEAYVGISHLYSRTNLQLVGDFLRLDTTNRVTLTLTCTLPLQGGASR